MKVLNFLIVVALSAAGVWAQQQQSPLTQGERAFFDYFLRTYDDNTALMFGFNDQEKISIAAIADSYHRSFAALRETRNRTARTEASNQKFAQDLDQTVGNLATSILNTIRPERAQFLRHQAYLVEEATKGGKARLATAIASEAARK